MIKPFYSCARLTYEVHPIPRARHETSVCQRVHRRQLVERHRLVHEVDRHELDCPESTVDPSDELIDECSKVLVFFNVLSRRNGKLYEDDLLEDYELGWG